MEVMEFTGSKDILPAAAVFINVAAEHHVPNVYFLLCGLQHSNSHFLRKKTMLVGNQSGDN